MDVEAGDLLKSLRTTNEEARKSALARPPGFGDLKIIDPTLLGRRDAPPAEGAPSTPWDAQVERLADAGPNPAKRQPASHAPSIEMQSASATHSADQSELHRAVLQGDLPGVRRIMMALHDEFKAASRTAAAAEAPAAAAGASTDTESGGEAAAAASAVESATSAPDGSGAGEPEPGSPAAEGAAGSSDGLMAAPAPVNFRCPALAELVNRKDKAGFTPLLAAANLRPEFFPENAPSELCKLLLGNGAEALTTDQMGCTALHWAAFSGNSDVVRLLATRGCPLDHVNDQGDSALHWASRQSHGVCVRFLLESGASCWVRDGQSRSPVDVAAEGFGQQQVDMRARKATRLIFYQSQPRVRTLVLHHPDCLEHKPRQESDWECPERIEAILQCIEQSRADLIPSHEIEVSSDFEKAPVELLARVHSQEYIRFVHDLAKRMEGHKAPIPFTPQVQRSQGGAVKSADRSDTAFSIGSLNAARRAAGAVKFAVDRVLLGRNRNAFCVVRPPGHHSGPRGLLDNAASSGFCIFNNIAAGALHALDSHRCGRVAIVDVDVHHGNGTEEIIKSFPEPHRLLFFSIHLYDTDPSGAGFEFFPGTGSGDDTAHNVINVPLLPLWKEDTQPSTRSGGSKAQTAPTSGRGAFRHAITSRLLPSLRAFNPDLILLSTGFDAAKGDVGNTKQGKSTGLDLLPEDFSWVTERIQEVADLCCSGRIVSVLEGGYGSPMPVQRITRGASTSAATAAAAPLSGELDRDSMAVNAIAHLASLVDPYRRTLASSREASDAEAT